MGNEIWRVTFAGGGAGTVLIEASDIDDALRRMRNWFLRNPGFEGCVITGVECLGPLWRDV